MKKNKTLLIVGLGNPGEKYESTPHNAGFLVVDQLITHYQLPITNFSKLKSQIAEAKIDGQKLILAKPQIFMNKSGEAVKLLITNYTLPITSLWLIHDDIDLALGQIKIVKNRGSAGHKGVEDIMRKLRTKDFVRFRVGTRPKGLPQKRAVSLMNKFVVSKLSDTQQRLFKKTISHSAEAIRLALEEGIEKTAGMFNR